MSSLRKAETLLAAFEENVATEAFLVSQDMLGELAELLEKQQPIVSKLVEILGPPERGESAQIQELRERLSQAYERRTAAILALQEKSAPLRDEIARIRHTGKMLQDWKKVWLQPDAEPSARLPTSYA